MFQFLKTSALHSLNKWTTMFFPSVFISLCLSGRLSLCLPAHHRNSVSLFELSNIKAASFFHSVWLQFKSFQVFVSLHPSDSSVSIGGSLNWGMHVASVWSISVRLNHYFLHKAHYTQSSIVLYQGGHTISPSGSKACFFSGGEQVWQEKEALCSEEHLQTSSWAAPRGFRVQTSSLQHMRSLRRGDGGVSSQNLTLKITPSDMQFLSIDLWILFG